MHMSACCKLSCWGMQVQDGKQAQYDAFYRLSNTEQQITSYVFDVSAHDTCSSAPQTSYRVQGDHGTT